MPADLNLKKSWHPSRAANQLRVHELEQQALKEHRETSDRKRELLEEREKMRLMELRHGGQVPEHVRQKASLGWMYESPDGETLPALEGPAPAPPLALADDQVVAGLLNKRKRGTAKPGNQPPAPTKPAAARHRGPHHAVTAHGSSLMSAAAGAAPGTTGPAVAQGLLALDPMQAVARSRTEHVRQRAGVSKPGHTAKPTRAHRPDY